jgi:hypothetical protein
MKNVNGANKNSSQNNFKILGLVWSLGKKKTARFSVSVKKRDIATDSTTIT